MKNKIVLLIVIMLSSTAVAKHNMTNITDPILENPFVPKNRSVFYTIFKSDLIELLSNFKTESFLTDVEEKLFYHNMYYIRKFVDDCKRAWDLTKGKKNKKFNEQLDMLRKISREENKNMTRMRTLKPPKNRFALMFNDTEFFDDKEFMKSLWSYGGVNASGGTLRQEDHSHANDDTYNII